MNEIKPGQYQVTFDITELAKEAGISKEKCAELLADEVMKLIFPEKKEKQCNSLSYLRPYY